MKVTDPDGVFTPLEKKQVEGTGNERDDEVAE